MENNNSISEEQGNAMADAVAAQEGAGMFGIDSSLQASNSARFKGGLHKAVLVSVVFNPAFAKKDNTTTAILQFNFVDLDNVRKHTHIEWELVTTDAKFAKKLEAFNIRIKHLIEAYIKFPEGGVGKGAKNVAEYYEMIAKAFNEGKNGKAIYKTDDAKLIPVHIKLVYFNNNLGFPYSPNFIEVVRADKETTLIIDKRYDKVEQTDAPSSAAAPGIVIAPDNDFL